jgi:hypothetical protein
VRGCCSHLFPPVPEIWKTPRPLCPKGSMSILTCSRIAVHTHTQKRGDVGERGRERKRTVYRNNHQPLAQWAFADFGNRSEQGDISENSTPFFLILSHWKSKGRADALVRQSGQQLATDSDQRKCDRRWQGTTNAMYAIIMRYRSKSFIADHCQCRPIRTGKAFTSRRHAVYRQGHRLG